MRLRSTARFLLEGAEGVGLLVPVMLTWPLSRLWLRNWGSAQAERARRWPGDDLVAAGGPATTRAVTIRAAPEDVWARIVQFGLRRAGYYSYELLERLAGIPVRNVESVEPAWQSLEVGDEVLVHPKAGVRVSRLERPEYVCFGKRTENGRDVSDASWSLYLVATGEQRTRLVLRTCFAPRPGWGPLGRLAAGLEAALDMVMEQRMLRTVRRLCECG